MTLARSTVAAGCAASRSDASDGAQPIAVWLDLTTDTASPWSYAVAFQDKLGVALSDLLPETVSHAAPPIATAEWKRLRHESGQVLSALMAEYRLASLKA